MDRRFLFSAITFLFLIVPGLVSASDTKISLAMEYTVADGKTINKSFGTVNVSTLDRRGLWVAFKKDNTMGFPGIVFGGNLIFCNDPIERMNSLELVVTVITNNQQLVRRSILFSKTRPMGSKAATQNNIYHLLVLDNFADKKLLPSSLGKKAISYEQWENAFFRTHRLAMNYAVQSDENTRRYEKAFHVTARYDLPRLILVAEEWLDIPDNVQSKTSTNPDGLFGGKLNDVGKEISEKQTVTAKQVPIYSIDVLLDTIEAKGAYPVGFQSARSIRNDILEGEVIFHATEGKRRVITTTTVFSQMEKNIITKNSDNRAIAVTKDTASALDTCEHLWPSVKKDIIAFLNKNPEWNIIIPEKPVTFYAGNNPAYALYAWYQVHPQTGRLIGVLPNSTQGAFSDELAIMGKGLLNKFNTQQLIETKGAPIKALFSQVAGIYVASAGVLDAAGLTICDPTLANLSEKAWIKFLTNHSLYFCQKFLQDNADGYDDDMSHLGFWQGAMFITYELNGSEAAREYANKAVKSITDRAINNARNYMEDTFKSVKKSSGGEDQKALDEGLSQRAQYLNEALKAVEAINASYDKSAHWEEKTADAVNRYTAAIEDLKTTLK